MLGGLGQPRQRQVEVQAAGHRLDAAPCQARTALPGHGPAGSGVRPRPLPPPYSEGLTLGSHEEQDLPRPAGPASSPPSRGAGAGLEGAVGSAKGLRIPSSGWDTVPVRRMKTASRQPRTQELFSLLPLRGSPHTRRKFTVSSIWARNKLSKEDTV